MRIRARDHVLHANSTLVDRVDLPPRYHCPLNRLPASRLLLPRSGLERSDFVRWPEGEEARTRCAGPLSGGRPDVCLGILDRRL